MIDGCLNTRQYQNNNYKSSISINSRGFANNRLIIEFTSLLIRVLAANNKIIN